MTATYEGANGIEDVAYDRAVQSACARTCRSLADGRPVAAISMFTMAGDLLDVLGEPTAEFGAAVLIDPDLREKETAEAEALADAVGIPLLIVHTTRSFTSTEKIECVASALRAKDLRCDVMLVDDTDPLHAHRDEVLDRIVAFLDDMNSDDS